MSATLFTFFWAVHMRLRLASRLTVRVRLAEPPKAGEHNCQVMLWLGTRVPQTCRICVESVCITCMPRLFKISDADETEREGEEEEEEEEDLLESLARKQAARGQRGSGRGRGGGRGCGGGG
eukprot:scaffold24169_cov186-Isochrysis_galbana.AAC.1